MKNKSKKWLLALLLSCSVVVLATGCDKLKKEPETESETQTEKVTEPPTEKVTEPQTEKVTEPPTEKVTETEPQTQPKELTVEEEKAQETEFDTFRTGYASDDVNVRTAPGSDGDIFDSFDQGETLRLVGETPNWYVVDLDDYEENGYVSKQFVSDTEVAPKTEEEREQLANGTAPSSANDGNTTASADNGTSVPPSTAGTSAVDTEYGVEVYAESFPIQATVGANMRQAPTQNGEIINMIASGTNVTAIGYTDRWYKVEYEGTVGYVNRNLFTAE